MSPARHCFERNGERFFRAGDGERSVIADNILDRDFEADRPDQKWLVDFTYIWSAEGWLCVAVVFDLCSRRFVGWSMKADRDASLVMDALMMAVWRRGYAIEALLNHSDQGSQYASQPGLAEECCGRHEPDGLIPDHIRTKEKTKNGYVIEKYGAPRQRKFEHSV